MVGVVKNCKSFKSASLSKVANHYPCPVVVEDVVGDPDGYAVARERVAREGAREDSSLATSLTHLKTRGTGERGGESKEREGALGFHSEK